MTSEILNLATIENFLRQSELVVKLRNVRARIPSLKLKDVKHKLIPWLEKEGLLVDDVTTYYSFLGRGDKRKVNEIADGIKQVFWKDYIQNEQLGVDQIKGLDLIIGNPGLIEKILNVCDYVYYKVLGPILNIALIAYLIIDAIM